MSDSAQIDLSKVIKKTAPLDELVADDLARRRHEFNLTDEQWNRIGDRPLFARRGLFRLRPSRSKAV
jgi:hypothetical protein